MYINIYDEIFRKQVAVIKRNRYLTIIPRARMGSESIAHEAEGRRPNELLTQSRHK